MPEKEIKKEAKPTFANQSLLDETMHWVKFNYLEQQGQVLEFSYGKTMVKSNGKKYTEVERYKMWDGEIYELPKYIIDHLNSKVVPNPKSIKNPDGTFRVIKQMRNRFGLTMAEKPKNPKSALIKKGM
ncbi:MAG: hypothetical protein ACFFG0_04375 [Candidatus Thorarchaeota archaeon]